MCKFCTGNNALTSISEFSTLAVKCVGSWYLEITKYGFNNPGYSNNTAQFTQLVWKNTTRIGVGLSWTVENGVNCYTSAAYYYPAGNIDGLYRQNVQPPTFIQTTTSSLPTTSSTSTATTSSSTITTNGKLIFYL